MPGRFDLSVWQLNSIATLSVASYRISAEVRIFSESIANASNFAC